MPAPPRELTAGEIKNLALTVRCREATIRAWLAGQPLDPDTEARITRMAWLSCGYRRPPPAQAALAFEA